MRTLFVVSLVLLSGVASSGRGMARHNQTEPGQDVVEVLAERFSFSPSELRTTVGTTLRIRLRSEDTDHGFHILGTDTDIAIPKRGRGVTEVEFTPERAGRYTFECSHVCGAGHGFMRGVIVVRDRAAEQAR